MYMYSNVINYTNLQCHKCSLSIDCQGWGIHKKNMLHLHHNATSIQKQDVVPAAVSDRYVMSNKLVKTYKRFQSQGHIKKWPTVVASLKLIS